MDLDAILSNGCSEGDTILEREVGQLKRNLNIEEGFVCDICNRVFKYRANYNRHRKSHQNTYQCFLCLQKFNTVADVQKHERGHFIGYQLPRNTFTCRECGATFNNYTCLFDHSQTVHPVQQGGNASSTAKHRISTVSALDDSVNVLNIFPSDEDKYDLLTFFIHSRSEIMQHLRERCEIIKHIKWYLNIHVEFERESLDGEKDVSRPYFKSATYVLLSKDELSDGDLNEAFQKQFKSFDEYIARGSGWTLKHVINMEVHSVQYRPIGGSSYFPIPESIQGSHAVINVQNQDRKCFTWSVLAHLHPVMNNAHRVSHYTPYEHEINMNGISYPVKIGQISKFESQNDIAVNVFGFEEGEFFPIYISKHRDKKYEIDLLYMTKNDDSHYCYIKNLNRLLSRTTSKGKAYRFCRYCLRAFTTVNALNKHLKYCSQHDAQHVEFPTKGDGDLVEFEDFNKQMMSPFVLYCDMEAYAKRLDTYLPNPSTSHTTTMISFEACSYGYQVVCIDERYSKPPVLYRGHDVAKHLIESLLQEEHYIREILDKIEPMHMTQADEYEFENSTHCFICGDMFNLKTGKVRDHCHISGKYRGAACSHCNLNFKHPSFIPVFFHNLRGFDSHLLMQGIGAFKRRRISVILNNMERYVSFSLGSLRFLDSYQFLQSSLSALVDDLVKEDPRHFKSLTKEFPSNEDRSLLLRKGVYPYAWVDCVEKFNETRLPPKQAFYNELTKSHISDEDYNHAEKIWDHFDLQNFGDFHDIYLKNDVLLLCDVFERFRRECHANYGLDPAHFFTSPGLAWSAALKVSKCRLELITEDIADAHLFIEAGLRGGISQISHRFATANNKYIPEMYDPNKESSYIIYIDCNNLYGLALSMPLPTGKFRFLDEDEITDFDVMTVDANKEKGYILEVDLDYPEELHDSHSDYPMAPITKPITDDMLSPFSRTLWTKLNPKVNNSLETKTRTKTPKLLCTLEHKKNYVCHIKNLKLYVKLGMQLKKVHRILEFSQSPFLKEYIELNTKRRQAANGEFQKSFFKLMNNAVFGKTMENLRNRVDVHLIHTKKKPLKQVAKSSFERFEIFNKDLVGVQCKKTLLKLNKPIAVGMSILELSKCVMYEHHYNYVVPKYGKKAKRMMTDTDSLLYYVISDDVYYDMKMDKHLFDFSNYDKNHFLYDPTNAKKPGLFKDETAGVPIQQFAGIRSKMYSLKYGDVEQKRAKGIVKSVVKKEIKHSQYVECLLGQKNLMCQQNLIRSHQHHLHVDNVNKVGLCSFDDKRYILVNGVETLAFGHYRISNLRTATNASQ